MPTLLPAVAALDDRRLRMFAQTQGRVLDLNDYSSHALRALVDGGDRFDTIVSILQISVAADAADLCGSLARLLADDGRLLFLEPTAAVGVTGAVQHAFGGWVRRTTGRRPDYDISALLRGAGLSISDCDRFTVRTFWPYRTFVEGTARPRSVPVAP